MCFYEGEQFHGVWSQHEHANPLRSRFPGSMFEPTKTANLLHFFNLTLQWQKWAAFVDVFSVFSHWSLWYSTYWYLLAGLSTTINIVQFRNHRCQSQKRLGHVWHPKTEYSRAVLLLLVDWCPGIDRSTPWIAEADNSSEKHQSLKNFL